MRSKLLEDEAVSLQYPRTFLWTSPYCYRPASLLIGYLARKKLEKAAGPLQKVSIVPTPTQPSTTETPVAIAATA
ncbi:hypothetical protein FRC17_009979 [Serendipita sp. 399]|nr:hypothetical protein FRC17_009979 [Serendipita sp. 399]